MSLRSGTSLPALAELPRLWWFPSIKGYRSHEGGPTYGPVDLDTLPPPPHRDPTLGWLASQPEREWAIGLDDGHPDAQRPLDSVGLATVVPEGLTAPRVLSELAERPELQQRVRSSTGCYLDLGDFSVPTTTPGAHLIHLLSDQQWVIHWLVFVDDTGGEAVLATPAPFCFDLPDNESPLPRTAPLDGSIDLHVCADSAMEFVARLWVENELWYATNELSDLDPAVAAYAADL